DSNPPPAGNYLHVIQEVDSHNALQQLMGTYPQWQGMLRADATKTFVVVTDDEGNPVPTVDEFAAFFDQAFAGSLWRFSGIYCVPGGIGGLNCSGTGAVYDTLVRRTGGVASDMSQPDWGTVFQQLGDAVIADARPVDCEWIIPPAPEGQAFAKDAVNVQFTGTAGLQKLYFAPGGAAGCSDQFLGWHYDNDQAPTKVVACPGTCPVLQADLSAKVEVLFGCPTEEPPIR
ncbi:MAG: hypothetical protein FJ104_16975, partial [Deltaproteobacteria bacterium]|nr:hypothetical protein [Deltaproteobacteria bacterium]